MEERRATESRACTLCEEILRCEETVKRKRERVRTHTTTAHARERKRARECAFSEFGHGINAGGRRHEPPLFHTRIAGPCAMRYSLTNSTARRVSLYSALVLPYTFPTFPLSPPPSLPFSLSLRVCALVQRTSLRLIPCASRAFSLRKTSPEIVRENVRVCARLSRIRCAQSHTRTAPRSPVSPGSNGERRLRSSSPKIARSS